MMTGASATGFSRHVHVVGAGLAGLSAAVALTEAGCKVTLHESGPVAGGRCRSYFDRDLGIRVDNGNHLLLSGNRAAFAYIDTIGARDTLTGPAEPLFPFIDLQTGVRWMLRPSRGRIPWWVLRRSRRVPGTRITDYLALRRIARMTGDATVARSLRKDALYSHLAVPLAIAALNTQPEEALARHFGTVLRETILAGGKACIPSFPREGLSESLIDPAVAWLRRRGATLNLSSRVTALTIAGDRVTALQTAEGPEPVEAVVLAVPPWVATTLVPGLTAPTAFEAIVNVHFEVTAAARRGTRRPRLAGCPGCARPDLAACGAGDATLGARTFAADSPRGVRRRVARDTGIFRGCHPFLGRIVADAALACGQGEACHVRRHRGAGAASPRTAGRAREPGGGRRLDRHRLARNDRRCDQVRPPRGRGDPRRLIRPTDHDGH